MTPEAASDLALCLANNPNNVANMVLLAGEDLTWGWFASRIQLSADAPIITVSPRPERSEQVAPFTLDVDATDAVKVELSSGEDHYFGDRQALLALELPMKLAALGRTLEAGAIDRALVIAGGLLAVADDVADPVLATAARASVGEVYRKIGRLDDAEPLLAAAADRAREIFAETDLNRAQVIENLGSLRLDQGRLDEARELFSEVVELREAAGDPVALAQGLCSLGLLCTRTGDLDGAIAASEWALQALDGAGVGDHPVRWRAAHNLGMGKGMSGDLDGSRPLLEQALEGRRTLLGDEHPETVESYASLGTLRFVGGDYAGAIELQKRAHELAGPVYGADHLELAQRAADLATSYKMLQTLEAAEKALPLLEQAHAIRSRRLGDGHPLTAGVAAELGGLRAALGVS